ncbi:hypothetical protein [Acidimangrovimonas sediminis]|uniref:hypothetical protein n=1 Tax=Acidimangrovimonas sediminis TaxID=2056283 RepID=UPI000C7F9E2C|nr:hypothetical protein [Acidimangrovimonas sediminis]
MPLSAVNVTGTRAGDAATEAGLRARIAALPAGAPVVVMIHGFRFSPSEPGQSPHEHILSYRPDPSCWKAVSWPRHLGFGPDRPGLAIALGWEARRSLWGAYLEAARAGAALARLLERVAGTRKVGLIAHSLGARVALQAVARLERPLIDRVVLLSAAEFRGPARRALASPAGRRIEVLNVRTRANGPFDLMLTAALPAGGRPLGTGLPGAGPRWLDLALDAPEARAGLRQLGYRIAEPGPRVCHWNTYLRPGAFALYRGLLTGRVALPALAGVLAVQVSAPSASPAPVSPAPAPPSTALPGPWCGGVAGPASALAPPARTSL